MYTYMMLHPCANAIADKIFQRIKRENYIVKGVYMVQHWGEVMHRIYSRNFDYDDEFQDHVEAHIFVNQTFFGDIGLLLLLHKDIPFADLAEQTLITKHELRDIVPETRNGTIALFVDVNKAMPQSKKRNGRLALINNGEVQKLTTTMNQEGRVMSVYFTYIHCADKCDYEQDYSILSKYIDEENVLSEEQIERVIKYKTFNVW